MSPMLYMNSRNVIALKIVLMALRYIASIQSV